MSEYSKDLYRWRKSHHICVECGKNDAFGRYVRCPECLEKRILYENTEERRNMHYQCAKLRIEKRKAAGVCVQCGMELSKNSKMLCEKHLQMHRKYQKAYQKRKRAEKRTKTLDQIHQERVECGRQNIIKARQSPNFSIAQERKREYWNKKYWSCNPNG